MDTMSTMGIIRFPDGGTEKVEVSQTAIHAFSKHVGPLQGGYSSNCIVPQSEQFGPFTYPSYGTSQRFADDQAQTHLLQLHHERKLIHDLTKDIRILNELLAVRLRMEALGFSARTDQDPDTNTYSDLYSKEVLPRNLDRELTSLMREFQDLVAAQSNKES